MAAMNRREFMVVSVATALWRPSSVLPTDVTIVQFSDTGERHGEARVAKVVKSSAEWRGLLSPLAFHVAREGGTEVPFSGAYWNLHDRGLFRCVCCENALFSSAHKFDSGTGWPSFTAPIAEENIVHGKPSHGRTESEVTCVRCDAHLGDLFDDGPKPTGLRYCIDSVSLRFVKF
jgi:peptide-methionine (R)-S-oxide reductase